MSVVSENVVKVSDGIIQCTIDRFASCLIANGQQPESNYNASAAQYHLNGLFVDDPLAVQQARLFPREIPMRVTNRERYLPQKDVNICPDRGTVHFEGCSASLQYIAECKPTSQNLAPIWLPHCPAWI